MIDGDSWGAPPHAHHDSIREAGACPECRAWTIDTMLKDAPHAFLLTFLTADGDPQALAIVRTWSPVADDAPETAWATGCNAGSSVRIAEIPMGVALDSGVDLFRLHRGGEAAVAYHAVFGRTLRH